MRERERTEPDADQRPRQGLLLRTRLRSAWRAAWPPALVSVLAIAAWESIVRIGDVSEFVVPTPSSVAEATYEMRSLLLENTWVTTQEILIGFVGGSAFGFTLAIALHRLPWFERAFYPLIVFFQTIPKIALAPIFLIWFGFGLGPKIALVVIICFFPVVLNTWVALKGTPSALGLLVQSVGGTRNQLLFRVEIPHALPTVFAGLKVAMTFAVIGAVVGEFTGGSAGLGYQILYASSQVRTPEMFAALVVLSVLGVVLYYAIAAVERLVDRWYAS